MNNGIKIIIYPVRDVAGARTAFEKFLGVAPYADQPYYVGFKVNNQDVGLVPAGSNAGATPYFDVDDIKGHLQILLDGGAEVVQTVTNVGGDRLIASVKDKDGNLIGLVQN